MLKAVNMHKRFGGIYATRGVSFEVSEGEILGLIGPNGAGKSTLFELLSGFQVIDQGEIWFEGKSLVKKKPHRINRMGLARTFQKLKPFSLMSVEDNVMVGALQWVSSVKQAREQALFQLERVGLYEKRRHNASMLSTGQRKRLELARALSTNPKLVLMDEVTGGVDTRSIPGLVKLVLDLRKEGLTFVVIEHNMSVLMQLCDRVVALHLGQKITEGTAEEVQEHPQVVEAYLGKAYVG